MPPRETAPRARLAPRTRRSHASPPPQGHQHHWTTPPPQTPISPPSSPPPRIGTAAAATVAAVQPMPVADPPASRAPAACVCVDAGGPAGAAGASRAGSAHKTSYWSASCGCAACLHAPPTTTAAGCCRLRREFNIARKPLSASCSLLTAWLVHSIKTFFDAEFHDQLSLLLPHVRSRSTTSRASAAFFSLASLVAQQNDNKLAASSTFMN